MNNFELSIFEEIRVLCLMALDAAESADKILAEFKKVPSDEVLKWTPKRINIYFGVAEEVNSSAFRNINSFISCCANISKLVWLDPKDRKSLSSKYGVVESVIDEIEQKLAFIRSALDLDNNETFHYENRGIRNAIEHYNVRLFALMARTGSMCSLRICGSGGINDYALGVDKDNCMRTLVVDRKEYIFQGVSYDMEKMKQDVLALLALVKERHPIGRDFSEWSASRN